MIDKDEIRIERDLLQSAYLRSGDHSVQCQLYAAMQALSWVLEGAKAPFATIIDGGIMPLLSGQAYEAPITSTVHPS